jgi:hypothetical protein
LRSSGGFGRQPNKQIFSKTPQGGFAENGVDARTTPCLPF